MKILAVGCGRRNGNTEILVKNALMGALEENPEAEVELIRLQDVDIKYCTGCELCMMDTIKGGDGYCIQKDDYRWIIRKFVEADGLILGSPIYDCLPPAIFIALLNRGIGAGRDARTGFASKRRAGAVIAVGGSDWTNLTTPVMDFTLRHYMGNDGDIVDRFLCDWNNAKGMVVLDEAVMERSRAIGKNIVKSLRGEEYPAGAGGLCPVCGTNFVEPREGDGINAACPLCDAVGKLELVDGKMSFTPTEYALRVNRYTPEGGANHLDDINKGHVKAAKGKETIAAETLKFKDFDPIIKPERA